MTIINARASVEGNKASSTSSSAIQMASCPGSMQTNRHTDNCVGINLIASPNVVLEHNTVQATIVSTRTINATFSPVDHVCVFLSDSVQIRSHTLAGSNSDTSFLETAKVLVKPDIVRNTVTASNPAAGNACANDSTNDQIPRNNTGKCVVRSKRRRWPQREHSRTKPLVGGKRQVFVHGFRLRRCYEDQHVVRPIPCPRAATQGE